MARKQRNNIATLNFHTTYIVNDPNGNMLTDYGNLFRNHGYEIKSFNLKDISRSNTYNPLKYIRTEADRIQLTNVLVKGEGEYVDGEKALLTVALSNASNMEDVIELIKKDAFKGLSDFAKNQYNIYNQYSAGAKGRIKASLLTRLNLFSLDEIKSLTNNDNISLDTFCTQRNILFIRTPQSYTVYEPIIEFLRFQIEKEKKRYLEFLSDDSVLVADKNDVPIKIFTADDADSPRFVAKEYFEKLQNAYVPDKPDENIHSTGYENGKEVKKNAELWSVRMSDGEIITRRGSQKEAKKALKEMKKGTTGVIKGLPFEITDVEEGFKESSSVRKQRRKTLKYNFPTAELPENPEPAKKKNEAEKELKPAVYQRQTAFLDVEEATTELSGNMKKNVQNDTTQTISRKVAKMFSTPKPVYKKIENIKIDKRFDEYIKELERKTEIDIFELTVDDLNAFA